MKKFIVKVLSVVIPIGVLVILVNIIVDPAALFLRHKQIEEVCRLMKEGKIVAGSLNLSERDIQREFIKEYGRVPDAAAVGSSRIMSLDAGRAEEYFGYGEFVNNGMSGSGIPDVYGIFGCWEQSYGELPKNIILCVDPWFFNANNGEERYKTLEEEIAVFSDRVQGKEHTEPMFMGVDFSRVKESISLSYFQSSLQELWNKKGLQQEKIYTVTEEEDTADSIRRPDGSIRHSLDSLQTEEDEVTKLVTKDIAADQIYQVGNYEKLDNDLQKMFEDMIEYLQDNGCDVAFYLAPFHPMYYQYFKENKAYAAVLQSEEYLLDYAEENGIIVYGSYDPEILDIDAEDFFDGIHLKDDRIEKAFVKR